MAEVVFWTAIAAGGTTYFVYPALLWLATRLLPSRDAGRNPPMEIVPLLDVVVAAYNEEAVIVSKVLNTLALDYPPERLRLYVISDGSTDDTVARARQAVPPDREGHVVIIEEATRRGKTAAINAVLPRLKGDVVLFTDANAHLEAGAAHRLARRISEPAVGCVVGELIYENRDDPEVRFGEGLYWRYENAIKSMESRLGSTIVANGALYAVKRRYVRPLGDTVEFDCTLPLLIIGDGSRVVFERGAVAREKAAENLAEEMRRKARIVNMQVVSLLATGRALARWPLLLLVQLLCHKLLRWIMAPLVPVALISAFLIRDGPLAKVALVTGCAFVLAGVLGWILFSQPGCPRALRVPAYFLAVNCAATVGLVGALAGYRITAWDRAESTR